MGRLTDRPRRHRWTKDWRLGVTLCRDCGNTKGRATEGRPCPGKMLPARRAAFADTDQGQGRDA